MAGAVQFHPASEPDFAVPPGESIREFLDELGMSQRQLASRLGLSPKHVNQLIQGLVSLSPEVATRLELVTGMPAKLWNRLEADYQTAQQRLRARDDLQELTEWLKEFPLKEMQKRGVLPDRPDDPVSRVQQLLAFFGVAHVSTYRELYQRPTVSFRQSKAFEADEGSVAVWLRISELAAHDVRCRPFDRDGLEDALETFRELTVRPFRESLTAMREICAHHGVAVVIVPEVKGARVCGATKWLNSEKAMLVLSGRYRTADQWWFTFFHEICHVLHHGKQGIWIEDSRLDGDPKEEEANRFARDLLIPPREARRLPSLKTLASAQRFADEIGIAPGIVVGRLQHEGLLPFHHGRKLKEAIELSDFADA
ncbi:HigA family addiction module antitoxin [Actinocorallia sp. B10E7]|uniref:HigA family addiction module antitoxin n=1 Tax=Actinocorallia sp. B10E7 TaxID=3153558 RepID=UPI00325F00BF